MRYVRMLVWICVVLFFPVHLAGCTDFQLIAADLERVPRDVPRSDARAVDASVSSPDAAMDVAVQDLSAFQDTSSSFVLDASDSEVLGIPASDVPIVETYPALVLSPTTCHGRTLRLPDAFFRTGLLAWHFCYVTPDPREREDGGVAPMRPASVCVQAGVSDGVSSLLPMVTAPAPTSANPWTASVAVALPASTSVPRFNVRQDPPTGFSGIVWALDADGRGGLRQRGNLRVWRVAADGQQMEVPLDERFLVCGGARVMQEMPSGAYVPHGSCPTTLRTCEPGPFHCS